MCNRLAHTRNCVIVKLLKRNTQRKAKMDALDSIKKDYFYFTGQDATWGDAHPQTGRRSTFGKTYRFSTKHAAEKFAEDDRRYEPIQTIGNARKIRKFNLGQSVDAFHESLAMLEYET